MLTEAEYRRETNDRLRRMETRLTRFMEWMGFDTEVRRPQFNNGMLDIPTDATSLRDCLAVIPPDWRSSVHISHKGMLIATLNKMTVVQAAAYLPDTKETMDATERSIDPRPLR